MYTLPVTCVLLTVPDVRVKGPECRVRATPGMTPRVVLAEPAFCCDDVSDEALVFSAGGFDALVVDWTDGLDDVRDAGGCVVGAEVGGADGRLVEVVSFAGGLLDWPAAVLVARAVGGWAGDGVEDGLGCDAGGLVGGVGGVLCALDRLSSAPTRPACVSRSVREASVVASGR
jgi:hypothetical protein